MRQDQADQLAQNQKENISLIEENKKLQETNKQLMLAKKADEDMICESDVSDEIPVRNDSKTKCPTSNCDGSGNTNSKFARHYK